MLRIAPRFAVGVTAAFCIASQATAAVSLTTLATFNGANGSSPRCALISDAGGNLYGTTELGGTFDDGIIFKLSGGTRALSTLATFHNGSGDGPRAGLVADVAGNFYGTLYNGGTGDGSIFKWTAQTQ